MTNFETLDEALIACVKACGGSKQVGAAMWPDLAPDQAQRKLLNSLDGSRPEKLSPTQVLLILKLARAKGFHGGINFIAADLGYGTPVPMEPRDEVADLMRTFNESVALQASLAVRIEKAAGRLNMRAAA
ncbi:MAG: hypothetical protein JJD98_02670 [Polaromonas sp.]|nr:hypothetical protein [Polaromonas sp.]